MNEDKKYLKENIELYKILYDPGEVEEYTKGIFLIDGKLLLPNGRIINW